MGTVLYWKNAQGTDEVPVEHVFKVLDNDNKYSISKRLKEQGVIKNSVLFYGSHLLFGRINNIVPGGYKLSTNMSVKEIIYTLEERPWAKYVTIPPNTTKEEMGEIIGEALEWGILDRQYFGHTFAGMQWQNYEHVLEEMFTEQYNWKRAKTETFLTLSSLYYDSQYDFFKNMYVSGTYEIPTEYSRAQVAGLIMEKFNDRNEDEHMALAQFLDQETMDNVANLIEEEMVLMPDIVAIPPQDVTIKKENGKSYILFTTSYWNKGRGPLDLIADPKTKGVAGDIDRNIYQRIYHLDGDYTERLSGRFLWHDLHRHYHFEDFAIYYFEPLASPEASLGSDMESANNISKAAQKLSFKSTFCVRDSEPIDLSHPGANKDADYKVCGRERQGISPGWADSYYYTYIDQRFDITNFPTGTYRLKVVINPKNRFDEITLNNNVGEVTLSINAEEGTVKVLEEKQYGI